jgi:hypothetical protein
VIIALLIIVFVAIACFIVWAINTPQDDDERISDTYERRWEDIRRERSRRWE